MSNIVSVKKTGNIYLQTKQDASHIAMNYDNYIEQIRKIDSMSETICSLK